MALSKPALALLDRLEAMETRLLTWGCVDALFSEEEVQAVASEVFQFAEGRPAGESDIEQVLGALIDARLLWSPPDSGGYRTRMAEGVRLFSRLRQIFPSRDSGMWRHAPSLVADYRLIRRPRAYPIRNIAPGDVIGQVSGLPRFAMGREVLQLLLGAGRDEQRLSQFQVAAIKRILHQVHAIKSSDTPRPSGTIVCAGTGSGKTKAFYVPALTAVADRIQKDSFWTKTIAIYPRNELLKDQFRAALGETLRLSATLRKAGRRPVIIGALFGDTPHGRKRTHISGWERATNGRGTGARCPFVRCPVCGAPMVWLDSDRDAGRERLVCFSRGCAAEVRPDEVRLTRSSMQQTPPDILFITTEFLNQRLRDSSFRHLFGVGIPPNQKPFLLLLDEVHTYEGATGAHVAYVLRRWRRSSYARPHVVGLSATLAEATQFLSDLTGIHPAAIEKIEPSDRELDYRDAEYLLALRGDPSWQTSLVSTSIQSLMLLWRLLATRRDDEVAGSRVFAFADNLDVVNRLYHDTLDAEGWWAPRRPKTQRPLGSLANLRASDLPNERERMAAGQNWRIVEDIGHSLAPGNRATVSRTSSQDVGVDRDSNIVVATSALEVGFDDPDVGGVLQHKAPRSAAPFLQRKGRAGRRIGTRPWTVVTLSDFGRDRIAYQAYDQLFSPVLPPRFLPLRNRAVLRMQATYVLLDWLAMRCGAERVSPWRELTGPVQSDEETGQVSVDDVTRQRRHIGTLQALLTDPATSREFTTFVARQLQITEDEATALLWEPPRAVLLEAAPTLLRRLESNWLRVPSGADLYADWNPLPDFLQKTLFGELLVPEVGIRIPVRTFGGPRDDMTNAPRIESMLIRQALAEFSPGRVSRRFGDRDARDRQWIDPGPGPAVNIDGFCPEADREFLGEFAYFESGVRTTVPVYRPLALNVTQPPDDVKTASNAFPEWRTEIIEAGERVEIDLPGLRELGPVLSAMSVHAHVFSNPVEVRRFVGSGVSTILRGKVRSEARWNFTAVDTTPVALGFSADVDAAAFRFTYPYDLVERCVGTPRLLRALRVARFRDAVAESTRLQGIANSFQREQLAEAWLGALTLRALTTGDPLPDAARTLATNDGAAMVREALDRLHLWADDTDDDVDERDPGAPVAPAAAATGSREHGSPRRLLELRALLENTEVIQTLAAASDVLWTTLTGEWEPWLRRRYRATLGAAVQQAAQDLCPRMASDAVVIDVPDEPSSTAAFGEDWFWLTETSLGGGAFIEEFQARVTEDPRRFVRMVRAALDASDLEGIGDDLERTLAILARGSPGDSAVRAAANSLREAPDHRTRYEALRTLREELTRRSVTTTRSFLVALQTRVLGPGTSEDTDSWLAAAMRRWTEAEQRLGIDVDVRVFALMQSEDTTLEAALRVSPQGTTAAERAVWRHSVVRGMLWPRGGLLRAEALKLDNPFARVPACDRLLVLAGVDRDAPAIDIAAPGWFEALGAELSRYGEARLSAALESSARLADAIRQFVVTPVETGGIHVYGRLAGIRRESGRWVIGVELREAHQ